MTAFELGMTPAQFWDLTPHEYSLAVKALNRKIHRQRLIMASLQAGLMNHIKACLGARGPRVTPNQLLGGRSFDRGMTRAEITEHFRSKGKLR